MQIAFLIYEGLTALDIIGPYEVFNQIPDVDVRFVAKQPGSIRVDSGAATLESTLWHDNDVDWDSSGVIDHTNDHTGDPAFVDPDGGDYHIGPTSAAIDAAVDTGLGDSPRPDMGTQGVSSAI